MGLLRFFLVPNGEEWGCLACSMGLGCGTVAEFLLVRGELGQPGMAITGYCRSHAKEFLGEDGLFYVPDGPVVDADC